MKYRHGSYDADPHYSSSRFRIAIIGSAGYIGSRLMKHLSEEKNWTTIGYDRIFPGQASYEISMRDLASFQVVIYLGGLTGRAVCRDYPNEVDRENIDDIHRLAKRMLPSQLLMFASTSAITEGSGFVPVDEDFPVQSSLLDSYASSLFRRGTPTTGSPPDVAVGHQRAVLRHRGSGSSAGRSCAGPDPTHRPTARVRNDDARGVAGVSARAGPTAWSP